MSRTINFFIPGHVPSSKNSRIRTAQGLFVVSKATRRYRQATKQHWREQARSFRMAASGLEHPLKVGFHFVRKTKHKYDWPNPLQTVLDEMVRYGWIPDDNIDIVIPVPVLRKGVYTSVDPQKAGVHIILYANHLLHRHRTGTSGRTSRKSG